MKTLTLYHTSFDIIRKPDIHYGRKNADFAQGFYLTDDEEFAHRWARLRKDKTVYVNLYELIIDDLNIYEFVRDMEWFKYIFSNRHNHDDYLNEYDVIAGPIANDTIYDTFGIITSGIIPDDLSLRLLKLGKEYHQYTIKTKKASDNLEWIDAKPLSEDEIIHYLSVSRNEELEYQKLFAEEMERQDKQ